MKNKIFNIFIISLLCVAVVPASLDIFSLSSTFKLVDSGTGRIIAGDCDNIKTICDLARCSDALTTIFHIEKTEHRENSLSPIYEKFPHQLVEYTTQLFCFELPPKKIVKDNFMDAFIHSTLLSYPGPARGA